jgi:hypothetical protein
MGFQPMLDSSYNRLSTFNCLWLAFMYAQKYPGLAFAGT